MSGLSDSDIQKLAKAFGIAQQQYPIRLSVDTIQLYTALIVQKILTPTYVATSLTIPANGVTVVTTSPPAQKYSLVTQLRISIDQDHAISYSFNVDGGQLILADSDMTIMAYQYPINLITELGALVPIKQNQTITITNLTAAAQKVGLVSIGGQIDGKYWDRLEKAIYGIIANALENAPAGVA